MVDVELSGKRVLICQNLYAPIKDGKVTCDRRIQASFRLLKKH
jgi:3-phosphoglycerate kinase